MATEPRLIWRPRESPFYLRLAHFVARPFVTPTLLSAGLEARGFPEPDQPLSVAEEVIWLLRKAAAIEHALLVQYLYTHFSLTPELEAKLRLAAGGKDPFRRTAIQEMGHLIAVQNLLSLLGGDVF